MRVYVAVLYDEVSNKNEVGDDDLIMIVIFPRNHGSGRRPFIRVEGVTMTSECQSNIGRPLDTDISAL